MTTSKKRPVTPVVAFDKRQLEEAEDARLALYARRSLGAVRKHPVDPAPQEADYRTEFQRDRDRIVHARAFRRLKHKTQVFIPFEGDHYRTRLTHTLEVTQVARTVARTLGLNEDLAEACALAHDVGHTPFGHSGEKALGRVLAGEDPALPLSRSLAAKVGAFKHNYQSVRVVDVLEKRYEHPGLNLTNDVREGILKHTSWRKDFPFPDIEPEGLRLDQAVHLEGQAVGWSDEIAQQAHDLEDGLPLVDEGKVLALPISRKVLGALGARYEQAADSSLRRSLLVRGMIHYLVTDLVFASRSRIEAWLSAKGITTRGEFEAARRRLPGSLVSPSPEGERLYLSLKEVIYQHVIHSHAVAQHDGRAQHVVATLFSAFYKNPRILPDYLLLRYRDLAGVPYLRDVPLRRIDAEIVRNYQGRPLFLRCIADHVAGMTDSYALTVYDSMYAPWPRHPAGVPAL